MIIPDTENRTIVSLFLWTKHWNVTDRQIIALAITAVCIANNEDALEKNLLSNL